MTKKKTIRIKAFFDGVPIMDSTSDDEGLENIFDTIKKKVK